MTFTEAAVEVLRRAGKPLHYKDIADIAVRENLLSHVGQDPEVTMGQRLAAMAKRDDERKVLAVAPDGTFALVEWSIAPEQVVEPVAPPLHPAEDADVLYRPREREPRPINAQARRRMEALQPGPEEPEEDRKRGQRRFPPPARPDEAGGSHTGLGRPMTAAQLVAEGRRAVVRALRRRVADLETSGFEQLCSHLLEKMGMRDVRVAKRSKDGPLYLARQRRGVSDLRTAVRLVRGSREIGRADVQELRKDLAHYSAQMGLVLAAGEAGRDARAEA